MFLKKARSLLKMDGMRIGLRGMLPIWPVAKGFAKHATLKARGVPVESLPKSPFIGSQTINGRALMPPPVKSVIGVQTCVPLPAFVEDTEEPTGHGCPSEMVAVVLEKVDVLSVIAFGLPLAYEVVPEICQLLRIAAAKPLLPIFRLNDGTS